jgi:hypothetical protein
MWLLRIYCAHKSGSLAAQSVGWSRNHSTDKQIATAWTILTVLNIVSKGRGFVITVMNTVPTLLKQDYVQYT